MSESIHGAGNQRRLDEYVPSWGTQETVSADNEFMARALAECEQMRKEHPEVSNPAAAVIVKEGKVLAVARNGSAHESFCPRIALNCKSGEDYDLCPDHCHFSNHAEPAAVKAVQSAGVDATGAELYLAGHYWACAPCWEAMKSIGITKLFLLDNAEQEYKKKRDAGKQGGGRLSRPLYVEYRGLDTEAVRAALEKVNIFPADPAHEPSFTIVLADGDLPEPGSKLPVFDYRDQTDYRHVLVELSRELDNFPELTRR